jgi:hypothetical protein
LADTDEIRIWQSQHLFTLLELREQNKNSDQEVVRLKRAITQARAVMQEPDIAWVEKQVALAYE